MVIVTWMVAKRRAIDFVAYHSLGVCIAYHRSMRYLGVDQFDAGARRSRMKRIFHLHCMKILTQQYTLTKSFLTLEMIAHSTEIEISTLGNKMRGEI